MKAYQCYAQLQMPKIITIHTLKSKQTVYHTGRLEWFTKLLSQIHDILVLYQKRNRKTQTTVSKYSKTNASLLYCPIVQVASWSVDQVSPRILTFLSWKRHTCKWQEDREKFKLHTLQLKEDVNSPHSKIWNIKGTI